MDAYIYNIKVGCLIKVVIYWFLDKTLIVDYKLLEILLYYIV